MLQYDNQAWNFFALALMSVYLVPSWVIIISSLYTVLIGTKDADIGAVARTSDEEKKANMLRKSSKGLQTLSRQFWTNFIFTTVLTITAIYFASSIKVDGDLNSFDPFHVLGIDAGANKNTIKNAYKKLALIWHPDKHNQAPSVVAKFLMIQKAKETLLDPVAKANYEKYGNPDGKQSLEVSIGLPSWLLDNDYKHLVLISYLIIMVGIIPFSVWRYYCDSSKFGDKDVMYDTYSWYHHSLDGAIVVKSLPETYAGSAEFRERNMPKSVEEKDEISKLMNKVRSNMQKPKYNHPVCIKGNVLLHAHLCRQLGDIANSTKQDLNFMLQKAGSLVDAMVSVCQHQEALKTAITCIEFGQYITQACWIKDNSLLQLPYFTNEEVKHATKGKTGVKDLKKYLTLPDDQKKGLADFTETQKSDVLKCCSIIPNLTVETKIFVDDDDDDKVYENDLCTVQVKITRNNLKDGEKAGLVHAPYFPFAKKEAWWIALGTKEGKIISMEKEANPTKEFTHNIKFLAPPKGTYVFDLYVLSNGYFGLDQKHEVELTTLDASVLPEYKVHPDDAELDDEPTLFEEMLNANVEEDSDSDEESEDEDEKDGPAIKELSAAEQKKIESQKRRKAAAADDDSDDESSVEEVYAD
mmetsp:Transcript_5457/g.7946  ORF Transcript_5457/g.7946 Transcript_5457/m.7946 type:complete len:638 (-) Transcript_5457:280-2193(-)